MEMAVVVLCAQKWAEKTVEVGWRKYQVATRSRNWENV